MDRSPKKPCKYCQSKRHFPYACRLNPKRAIKRLKRSPIKRIGKTTKQWFITRATWIRKNPPPIDGKYWECYLQIHPWCPKQVDIKSLTLDHVVARTKDPSLRFKADNLRPCCVYCNGAKGSKRLDQVKPDAT